MATPKMRTMRRAAEVLGGEQALAEALGATVEEIADWISGTSIPRDGAYLAALDIVAGAGLLQRPAPKR